jgi:hypothetical protein
MTMTATAELCVTGSSERFGAVVSWLGGDQAAALDHGALEAELGTLGRDLLRQLFQDHLDLRASRERRIDEVAGLEGTRRGAVEAGHARPIATVFGEVSVDRLAYRSRGQASLHPADAVLNLPAELYSHGLRRLAAEESSQARNR